MTLSPDVDLNFASGTSFTFGGLSASSAGTGYNLALTNSGNTPIALTVGGNNSSITYKGVLSGGGSLIKTGSGTLILGGASTYAGNTTLNGGTLQVDGSTVSPTRVNSGATLGGDGAVNAAVTVAAGGSVVAGDGTVGSLVVSSLTFSGTGTLKVGALSGYTSVPAIKVTNALTLSGGAGAVTVNLPKTQGYNGTYRLVQFGSGIANTSGFTLGTIPALTWNQTGTLQVSGNYLVYVITATADTTPPTLRSILPVNNATNVLATTALVAAFNETVVAGSGSIELHRSSDASLVESFNVASSTKLTFSTTQLTIQPTNVLATGQSYYVLVPVGTIKDTSGNSYAGITSNTGWKFTVPVPAVLYTNTGSPANPLWSAILPTLNVNSADPGPVYGSLINVNNAAVETGLYGNRPVVMLGTGLRIHVACNTSTNDFASFTRWFQTDGNTQMLRVFVNDENTATPRTGTSSHTEAFMGGGWNYTDSMTYEWTAHYTIARLQQGYACFQLKNTDNDWAVQLSMGTDGSLTVNNRIGTDVLVTNPDGSAKSFNGGGFDVRVIDDGLNYKLWIDGVLYADGSYSRPTGTTTFRWGMYFGANNLNPPATYNLILVSGAQVQSWPGNLNTATTTVTKANNTTNLGATGSWTGGVVPGIYKQAQWNSPVTAANTTTLNTDLDWAGIKIVNPGGAVTINGTSTLGLDDSGVDMTAATQNLAVNCPVELTAPNTFAIATGRTATFNGIISGYPGITVSGGGTVQLNAANIYSGDTTLSGGTLVANNNSALGAGLVVLNGGSLANSASCTLGNDVSLNSNATVNVVTSQTLTLNGSIFGTGSLTKSGTGTLAFSGENTYSGATIVSGGTLAISKTGALLTTSSLTLADGSLLQPTLDDVVILAPITVGSSGTTATISAPINAPGGGAVSTLTLNSGIGGSGNVTFSSSVAQNAWSTVYLGAQSTYLGSTLLDTAGNGDTQIILKLGSNNALPATTVLTIDGQIGTGSVRFAELNLNGSNQQLAGLTNVTRSLRSQRVVNSNVSAPSTLTINNSADYTFSGNLGTSSANGSVSAAAMPGSTNGNNFGLTKSGVGNFTLGEANTYTGNTVVNAGTLSYSNASALSSTSGITLAGGTTLQANNTGATINAPITLGANGTTASITGPLTGPTGGAVYALNLNGAISGAGNVTFTNSQNVNTLPTVLLNAPGTYAGSTLLTTTAATSGTASNQIIVKLGVANALPPATVLTIDGGNGAGSGCFVELNLNGFNQQLAGLTNIARNLRLQRVVNSDVSAAATLTVNNTSNYSFSGNLGSDSPTGSVSLAGVPGSSNGNNFGLTKSGAGTFALTNTNTYSGNTTVNQGTLSLATINTSNETSTVTIASTGATLNLTFTGTDTVKNLFIGTTQMPPGVYEAVGNPGAGIEISQLTGTGTLTVTTGPVVSFATWKVINGTAQAIDGDHDNDGVKNGIEYFIGGPNSKTNGSTPLPGVSKTGSVLSVTWTKSTTYTGVYGTDFAVETSPTLTSAWTTEAAAPAVNATVTFPSASTVKYTFPSPMATKRFARLKVTGP